MMKLAVPPVEQAWAHTTAPPVASPAPYYEARSLTHPRGKSLDMVLPGIFAFVQPSRRKTTLHKMDKSDLWTALTVDAWP